MTPLKAIALCVAQALVLFNVYMLTEYNFGPGGNLVLGVLLLCSTTFVAWVFVRLLTSKEKE